ncbi:MAG: hypothetical protein Q8M65_10855 [Rhodoglobus sp.]|nr:hypothetical protein [Rhodoglobus sp.]
MKRPWFAALPATLLAACAALGPFEKVDSNGDGGISREEARRSEDLVALFDSADDDQDGVLNPEEYELVREVLTRDRTSAHRGPPKGSGGGHSH